MLGLSSAAESRVVERAERMLAAELKSHPKLAERVAWAAANFTSVKPGRRPRIAPATPPPPSRGRASPRPGAERGPAAPGLPDGLQPRIDFGTVAWGDAKTVALRLTWKQAAPYGVKVDATPPIVASVTTSKALPGRFVVTFGIDWDSPEFSRQARTRGYTLDTRATLRWTSTESAEVRIRGLILYPAVLSVSPPALDLGEVRLRAPARASLIVVSTAPAVASIELPAWLHRVDAAGRPHTEPQRLETNTPIRLELGVVWAPIEERGAASLAAGRPLRPTGRIVVRWEESTVEVPVQMLVEPGSRTA